MPAFRRGQGRAAGAPRRFHRLDDFAWIEQLEVQRRRDVRVPQPRRLRPQRVLPASERGQPLVDEPVERTQRLRARHRPREIVERTGMVCETLTHQREYLARDRIGFDRRRRRDHARTLRSERCAVLGVEIPATAGGLVAVHQHAMPSTQMAIEDLQTQFRLRARPGGERPHVAVEVPVGFDHERDAGSNRCLPQLLQHAPVAGCSQADRLRTQPRDRGRQFRAERAQVFSRVELPVMHRPALRAPVVREMPHGAQEQRDARQRTTWVDSSTTSAIRSRPASGRSRRTRRRRRPADRRAPRRDGGPTAQSSADAVPAEPARFARRQRSEQWRTASQVLAHARRHVIVRPQTAQGLLGR